MDEVLYEGWLISYEPLICENLTFCWHVEIFISISKIDKNLMGRDLEKHDMIDSRFLYSDTSLQKANKICIYSIKVRKVSVLLINMSFLDLCFCLLLQWFPHFKTFLTREYTPVKSSGKTRTIESNQTKINEWKYQSRVYWICLSNGKPTLFPNPSVCLILEVELLYM